MISFLRGKKTKSALARSLIAASSCTALLASCATPYSGSMATSLNSNQLAVRNGLLTVPEPLPAQLNYSPNGTCTFRFSLRQGGQAPRETTIVSTSRLVRDRIHISSIENGETSTMLMERNGVVNDYNLVDTEGRRWTPETRLRTY
jgi:hypothetical protein